MPAKKSMHRRIAMTKTELISAISDKLEMPKKQVIGVFLVLEDIVMNSMKKDIVVTVPNLVRFKAVHKKARPARQGINPQTKETITISAKPATTVIKAYVTSSLKNVLSGSKKK